MLTQEQEAKIRAYLAELHAAYEGTVTSTVHIDPASAASGAPTYRTERTTVAAEPPTLRTWE